VSCDKIQYTSPEAAHDNLTGLRQRQRHNKFSVYKCTHCGFYHITTITKHSLRTPKRIDKYPIKPDEIKIDRKDGNRPIKKKKKKK
jgi:hypothetical protein